VNPWAARRLACVAGVVDDGTMLDAMIPRTITWAGDLGHLAGELHAAHADCPACPFTSRPSPVVDRLARAWWEAFGAVPC